MKKYGILSCLAVGACVSLQTVNIGTKTSLEKQLIGEFEPLNDEELLVASVRDTPLLPTGAPDSVEALAWAARRRQLFNRDDVDELKSLGCVGEAGGATLVARACPQESDKALVERRARILSEEAADRAAIVNFALENDATLTKNDRNEVLAVYSQLLRDQLKAGEWWQDDKGQWQQKDQ